MSITTQDVKLFKSQRIDDTAEGGGRMTGTEVVDNQLNNVFDDTSRLDRVYGRVSLRKVFGAVSTDNRDKFLGAHAIVTDPPDDGRVAVTILELNSHTDQRDDAKLYVESYLVTATATVLTLFDSQPAGARTIVAYQDATDPVPSPGDVLVLSVEATGHPSFGYQQFVRISGVSSYAVETNGVFKTVYTFELGSALEITYPGSDIVRSPSIANGNRPTRIRKVDLNPAIRYYGVVPLAEEAEPGDSLLQVDTILQPVVPASYSESPILDQQVGDTGVALIEAGPSYSYTVSLSSNGSGVATLRVPGAVQPGSALIVLDNATADYDVTFDDSGDGSPDRTAGGSLSLNATCAADYATATFTFTGLRTSGTYTATVSYTPAVAFSDVQHTAGTLVTTANRGFNYALTAIPKPAPGTTRVRYRALGRWYELRDNGGGQLTGDAGTGAGTINYLTGTINVTVGYQPDVGSHVLFGWGTGAHYTQDVTPDGLVLAAHRLLASEPVKPGSLEITFTASGDDYTVTDDGEGALTGDASGTVNYDTGEILAELDVVPAMGTAFTVEYLKLADFAVYTPDPQPAPDMDGDVQFTLPGAPIEPGTVSVAVTLSGGDGVREVEYRDRGDGFVYSVVGSSTVGTARGTINYTTGAVDMRGDRTLDFWEYGNLLGTWTSAPTAYEFEALTARYQAAGAGSSQTDSLTPTEIVTQVNGADIGGLVGGSLLFTLNGRAYFDGSGDLFYLVGNTPTDAGSFDASAGRATATSWVAGPRVASLNALLTRYGRWPLTDVIWSTMGAPIRSGSFQVTDGINTAISDDEGDLTGALSITGSIDYETGVYQVTFADPGIAPESGRYNAVVLTYLPLNPTILGLNPVRLPLSGTVPVIQQGDTLVIHNTVRAALPNPVVAGTTYDLPRGNLAYAVLYDATGATVPTDRYTTDLVAGEITFENPLDLDGYTQPLQVEHRIEDMLFCLDAQLSGAVSIVPGGLTRTYPAPGSYVSSAKLIGDLQAAATEPFDQQAWTDVWSNSPIGSPADAEYNDLAHPIEVTNQGAIEERWRVEFTSSTAFRLFGEESGQVPGGSGTTASDFSPVNLLTGEPYFTIRAAGWGGGWVAGNQLRFNTAAAAAPLWLLRCTLQGPEEEPNDNVRVQFRGDSQ